MDLLELFKRHLASKEGSASNNTIKNYLSDVRHFTAWYENLTKSNFEANSISTDIIKLYQKTLGGSLENGKLQINSQLSVASMKRHISSLRKFFTVLEDQNVTISNPFNDIKPEINDEPTDYWHLKSFKDYHLSKGSSPITIKNYISDIASFAKWYEATILPGIDKPLSSTQGFYLITQNVLEDYKDRLVQIQNSAPRTINRKLSSLRSYLEFANKMGFISTKELFLTPVQIAEAASQNPTEGNIKLNEIKIEESNERNYSVIPPVRLLQRLMIFPYLSFEEKAANVIAGIITGTPVSGVQKLPNKLANLVKEKNSLRTQHRSISNIMAVSNVEKEFYAPNKMSLLGQPLHKKIAFHIKYTRPEWYKKYHDYDFVHYAHFALLIIFASGVGVALYQNLVLKKQQSSFAAPTAPPRVLSFQGRLTDNVDNPITSQSALRFAIYNDPSASGGALLWQEAMTDIFPDQDGIFSVYLGGGTQIPSTVFSDNSSIYLGVTVATTTELAPRQRIATVGYASNAEFLQGLPPTTQAGITSFTNVVLALDSSGNLSLSDSTPTNHSFQVTNGQFRIQGQATVLSTNTGTNGNVILSPDGLGRVDVTKGIMNSTAMGNIAPGAVQFYDKVAILATESAVAAFIVNNNTTGGDILSASSSGTPRFTIQNDGTIVSGIYTGQNGVLYGTQTTGVITQVTTSSTGLCLQSGVSNPTWGTCGGAGYFNLANGALSPINDTLDLLIGGQTTASAKFRFLNNSAGTPVASVSANSGNNATFLSGDGSLGTTNRQTLTIGNSSSYNTTGNILFNPNGVGRIGINTTSILASLDIRANSINGGTLPVASISGNTSNAVLQIDNSGSGDLISASSSGVPNFIVKNNGDIIVGQGGLGKITAAVVDPYLVQNQKTTGITSLTFQTMGASGADFIFANTATELSRLTMAGQFRLPITDTTGGIVIGGDTQIYRDGSVANQLNLASGDSFNIVSGSLLTGGVTRIDSSGNGTFNTLNITGGCTGCTTGAPSPFQVLTGAIVPLNSTLDVLIGSQATASAKFAVLNINSGTPTASVSSGVNGTGAYFDANGSFQTVKNQTLTLGGSTTGNIVIDSNSGLITLSDNTTIGGNLTVSGSGTHAFGGTIDPTNVAAFTLTGGITGGNQNISAIGDITANSSANNLTGFGTIGTNGTTTFQGITLNISGDATISGGDITGAGGAILDIGEANAGDFTFNGDIILPEDGFIGISATTPRFVFDTTPTPDEIDVMSGNLDLNTNLLLNIGDNATDFTTGGGLTLAGTFDANGQVDLGDGGDTISLNGSTITLTGFTSQNGVLFGTQTTGVLAQATTATPGQCLVSTATNPSWGSCSGTGFASPFQALLGAIIPLNSSLDTLLGGQSSMSAVLKVTGQDNPFKGTLVGASISANTSFAGFVVDNKGVGDIFTASAAGTTQLVLKNNGSLGLGLPAGQQPTAKLDVNGIASVSSQLSFRTGAGAIQTTANNTLTIGGTTTGQIIIDSASGVVNILDNTNIAGNLTGLTGLTLASGAITLSGSTGSGQCLLGGSTATWGSCSGTGFASPFQVLTGAIAPLNSTLDFFVGGQSTASAKFAVLNMNSGTPTASVSAGINGGAYLTAAGNLQTTAFQPLTLGGPTTGDITLNPRNSVGNFVVNALTSEFITGATTQNALNINGANFTTGEILDITSTHSPTDGSTNEALDINITHSPTALADVFNAIDLSVTDGTTLDNYVGGINTSINLTGDADKSGAAISGYISNSSALGGSIYGGQFTADQTGIITGDQQITGAQVDAVSSGLNGGIINAYGLIANTNIQGDNGTMNATGIYSSVGAALTTSGTANLYGVRISQSVGGTVGTKNRYGLYIDPQTDADNGYGLCFDCDGTWTSNTVASGIQFGTDANGANLYRSGNNQLTTDDGFYADLSLETAGSLQADGNTQLGNDGGDTLTIYGTSVQLVNGFSSNGGVLYTNGTGVLAQVAAGTNTQCLLGGTTPTFGSCGTGVNSSPFQYLLGSIVPTNTSADFLAGGQASTSATLKVTGAGNPFAGTLVGASVSANTSFAGFVIDNKGVGDIFTASSSGVTQLVLKNNGSLGLGILAGQQPTAKLDVNGIASVSSQLSFRTGAGAIQTTANNTLTIGGATTGQINIDSASGVVNILDNTNIAGNLTGLTGLTLASGAITLSGSTGTDLCLVGGTTASWSSCGTGIAASPFEARNGAIVPGITTLDFLAGGTSSTSAAFRVTGQGNPFRGTVVGASISAETSFAGFVIDNKGVGDIFTASSSGVTQLVLKNNGSLGLGILAGQQPTAKLDVNGIASVSSQLSFRTGAGNIQTTANNTLTIGGATTGNIVLDSASGQVNILDNTNISGNLTGLTGLTMASGAITLSGVTGTGLCLVGGTTASWSSCGTGTTSSPFETRNGAIVPGIITLDFLAGGTSSTSAAFKVTGQGNPFRGTQVGASISANTSFAGLVIDNKGVGDIFTASSSGMTQLLLSNNGSLGLGLGNAGRPTAKLDVNGIASVSSQLSFRTGAGNIQTTANNTLTIGGATTGNINIDSASGVVSIFDNTNIAGNLTGLTGLTLASGAITLSGSTGTGLCLTGGTTATWATCDTGTSASPFEARTGAIVPGIVTLDFLAGGTSSTSAAFRVTGQGNPFRGTQVGASISANTSHSALVIDNRGVGDIFSASSSGVTQMFLKNNGSLGLGLAAANNPTAKLDVNGAASISAQLSFRTGIGAVQSTANNGLILGGNTTGDITLLPRNGSGILNLSLSSTSGLKMNGTFGAALTATNSCVTDIVNGIVTGTATCSGGSGGSNWTLSTSTGVIRPNNNTVDFLLGGTSTASAKFAVLNLNTSTPVASVSGNFIVMPNNGWAGNVGIGTTNPFARLHLFDPVNDVNLNIETQGTNKAANLNLYSTIGNFGQISHFVSGTKQWMLGNNGETIGSFNIYTTASNINRLGILANGQIFAGTNLSTTPLAFNAKFNLFSDLTNQPAASISANTSGPLLWLSNSGTGDLIAASTSAGLTTLRVKNNGDIYVGFCDYTVPGDPTPPDCGGAIKATSFDPLYTIDGKKYSTYAPSMIGIKEEMSETVHTTYNPSKGAYTYVINLQNQPIGSDLWVFSRVTEPDVTKHTVLLSANSTAKTWYQKDPSSRSITIFSDRPTEVSYRLTALRFDNSAYPTINGDKYDDYKGIVAPPQDYYSSYYNPVGPFEDGSYLNSLTIAMQDGGYVLRDSLGNNLNKIDAFSKVIAANIKAGLIDAQRITTNSFDASTAYITNLTGSTISFTQGSFSSLASSVSSLGNATASTLAISTDAMSIGGQNIRDFIIDTVRSAGFINTTVISPIAQIDNIKTNTIKPLDNDTVRLDGKLAVTNSASIGGNLTSNSFQTNEATIGGTLRADNIIANNISGLDDKLATLAAGIASGSLQQVASNSSFPSSPNFNLLTASTVRADFGIFEQGITSMGPITASDITAIDTLMVGANFSISNNSINTLGADLEIQSLRQGNIAFQGGLIKMDTDGNMEIAGNLNVIGEIDAVFGVFSGTLSTPSLATSLISPLPGSNLLVKIWDETSSSSSKLIIVGDNNKEVLSINGKGDIASSGSATFAKLNFNLVGQAEATSLTTAVATGSAGFATLRAYQPEITIKNVNVTSKSLIYITPFGDTNNKILYLLRQTPQAEDEDGSFTVGVSGASTTQNIQFNWLIVN